MRISLELPLAKDLGNQFNSYIRSSLGLQNQPIDHATIKALETKFHDLSSYEQPEFFTKHFWAIVGEQASTVQGKLSRFYPTLDPELNNGKRPIVPGFKDGVDIIAETIVEGDDLYIHGLNVDKGGLASNTTEAFLKLGLHPEYITLHGEGSITTLHESLLESAGVIPSKKVHSKRDNFLHPCILFGAGKDKKEYWLVQKRTPFNRDIIEQFTASIMETSRANSDEVLVLSALPPTGAGDDYFGKLSSSCRDNVIFFNPKEYDYIRDVSVHLFDSGVDLIKPNVVEFVEFLRYSGIIEDTNSAQKIKINELKEQVRKGNIDEVIDLGKELMKKYKYGIRMILVSFSEHGSIIMNSKWAVYVSAPKIGDQGCSSGAGDSGLANLIVTAKKEKINLRDDLNDAQLQLLGKGFNFAASKAADLPGNQLPTAEQISDLMRSQVLKVVPKKLVF